MAWKMRVLQASQTDIHRHWKTLRWGKPRLYEALSLLTARKSIWKYWLLLHPGIILLQKNKNAYKYPKWSIPWESQSSPSSCRGDRLAISSLPVSGWRECGEVRRAAGTQLQLWSLLCHWNKLSTLKKHRSSSERGQGPCLPAELMWGEKNNVYKHLIPNWWFEMAGVQKMLTPGDRTEGKAFTIYSENTGSCLYFSVPSLRQESPRHLEDRCLFSKMIIRHLCPWSMHQRSRIEFLGWGRKSEKSEQWNRSCWPEFQVD